MRFFETLASKRSLRLEEANRYTTNPIHPLRIVSELQKFLTDDVTLCLDMGSFYLWIAHFLYSFRARQVLISNGQQTLGVALPWGIASCLLRPHEKDSVHLGRWLLFTPPPWSWKQLFGFS